ncbi:MAG: cyclodeaminase/cyclohydrolase family protein [Chloroflexi bacterium]|nr:cyclodeaminase/cyclohydrolase family protein [Chloroflexota bacterium]
MYAQTTIGDFLDRLGSKASTPGGGSVAALSGALGAALVSMVCNLTVGKEKFKDVEPVAQRLLNRADELRAELTKLIDDDTKVLGDLMEAYGLPRNTDEEKQKRTALIQERSKIACGVPIRIARACNHLRNLTVEGAKVGNPMAISDIGVAVLMAEAGLHAALLNVDINIGAIKDAAFVEGVKQQVAQMVAGRSEMKESVLAEVKSKL